MTPEVSESDERLIRRSSGRLLAAPPYVTAVVVTSLSQLIFGECYRRDIPGLTGVVGANHREIVRGATVCFGLHGCCLFQPTSLHSNTRGQREGLPLALT